MIYLDGIGFTFLAKEIKEKILNSRISKINIYDSNSFTLQLTKYNLYFDNKTEAIVYLKDDKIANTQYEIPFILSLKKYITGAIIKDVYTYNMDRILILELEKLNMVGNIEKYKLIYELFPKSSNVVLIDENSIVKAVMYVNIKLKRQILTNLKYVYPDKVSPYGKYMQNICYEKKEQYTKTYTPVLYSNNLFSYNKFLDMDFIEFDSLNQGLNEYFRRINETSVITNKKKPLIKHINKNISRLKKILIKNKKDIKDNKGYEKYKILGDLLASNIYRVKYQDEKIEVFNYYTNENEVIYLDKQLSPSKNLEKIYSKYAKAKRREESLKNRNSDINIELNYYNELLLFVQNEKDLIGLEEIEKELGLLNKKIKSTKNQKRQLKSIEYKGYTIYIGRNNIENDKLTFEIANKNDLWFHAKDVPASHVILVGKNPSEDVIYYTAKIAGEHSKSDGHIEVDYCLIKNVKKIAHAKKGQVTYTNYQTIKV